MNIGIVHPELIYPRGAERQVCELCSNLQKMGNEVTIYTFEKKKDYYFDEFLENVNIISLDKKWIINSSIGLDYPRWLIMIRELSEKIEYHDVLNFHNAPAQWVSNFTDIKSVWTCNEPLMYHGIPQGLGKLKYLPFMKMDKILSNPDLILALDKKMESIIKKRYNKPVECFGSGVSLLRPINHIENEFIDVIFVGPIYPQKRPLDIIESISYLNISNFRIHFVGEIVDKNLHTKMLELANKKNLEIIYYGSVSDEELYNLYDLADLSIFVPELHPWGIFPLETILSGIPTIISDQCGINDFISNQIFRVETGNIIEISAKILEILNNYDFYKEETNKLAKIISQEYSWESHAKKMLNILKESSKS